MASLACAGALLAGASAAVAAELRGVVDVEGIDPAAPDAGPVYIAAWPDAKIGRRGAGQPARPGAKRPAQVIAVSEQSFRPANLMVSVGDRLHVVNRDGVFHALVLRRGPARSVHRLAPGAAWRTVLAEAEVWYLFCQIHQRAQARIDVVDTPWIQTVSGGRPFEFKNLAAGPWRLRTHAAGTPIHEQDATAYTAPSPVRILLRRVAPGAVADDVPPSAWPLYPLPTAP